MASSSTSRLSRYRVEYWHDQPDVGYSAALGVSEARRWACFNARTYGGRVMADYTDGTSEEVQPYGGQGNTQKSAA